MRITFGRSGRLDGPVRFYYLFFITASRELCHPRAHSYELTHTCEKRLPRTWHTLAQDAHGQRFADPHAMLKQQAQRLEPHTHGRCAAPLPEPQCLPRARDVPRRMRLLPCALESKRRMLHMTRTRPPPAPAPTAVPPRARRHRAAGRCAAVTSCAARASTRRTCARFAYCAARTRCPSAPRHLPRPPPPPPPPRSPRGLRRR